MAAQVVRWSDIPVDARSNPAGAPSLAICRQLKHREIRGAQGALPMWVGMRPVN